MVRELCQLFRQLSFLPSLCIVDMGFMNVRHDLVAAETYRTAVGHATSTTFLLHP